MQFFFNQLKALKKRVSKRTQCMNISSERLPSSVLLESPLLSKQNYKKWLLTGLVCLLWATGGWSSPAEAQVAFASRFSTNDTGDIQIVGNTLMTCPGSCPTVQDGTSATLNNNSYNMAYVDIDSDGTTINSSSATLTLPPSSTVLFAGLYWAGDSASASRNQVKFATPSSAGYTSLTGAVSTVPSNNRYQGFTNVTALVQAAGSGAYTVANVQSTSASADRYAGWSLVVVIRDPAQPARNLVVFDGLQLVNGAAVNIPLSGFTTPPAGPVNARLGIVAYEGDRGTTGDVLKLNNVTMSDTANPANNFFNSSIARFGTDVTAKNPNYINQLGFDIDVLSVLNTGNTVIANSATSATINLSTTGDVYIPGVVTTAIDIFSPTVAGNVNKTVTNLNRNDGTALPGDVLEYTISVGNTGQDGATNVVLTDSIPTNTTYVAGSLQVTAGANSGTKTDTAANDQAEYDSTNTRVVFRLGTGATGTSGGTLAPAVSTTVKFKVQIIASPTSSIISNQATVAFNAQTLGTSLTATSDGDTGSAGLQPTTIAIPANLSITKTDSPDPVTAGNNLTYTIAVTNSGPVSATSAVMNDPLPAGTTFQSITTPSGWTCTTPTVGTTGTVNCTHPSFAVGSATFTVVIKVNSTQTTNLSNTATVTSSVLDSDASNNSSTQTTVVIQSADLKLSKTATPASPAVGGAFNYTITVTNDGPSTATNVQVTDRLPPVTDVLVNSLSITTSQGSAVYNVATPNIVWTVGTLAPNTSATLTIPATRLIASFTVNVAEVTASTQSDPDSTPGNNIVGEDDQASVTVPSQSIDLAVAKSVNNPTPSLGQSVVFTVSVTNTSPSFTATGVGISDALPAGLTYQSSTTSQGTYTSGTGIWSVGSLSTGTTATLTITATVNASGTITNTAQLSALDQTDPNSANNNASATVTPSASNPKLILVKRITAINTSTITTVVDPNTTADPNDNEPNWPAGYLQGAINGGLVRPGDELEYTIYFLSDGDSIVKQVQLCDLISTNSTFSPRTFDGLTPTDGGLPGADAGIAVAIGPTTTYLSNVRDTDRGEFFVTGSVLPASCSSAINPDGAIVVNVVTNTTTPSSLPNATSPGNPTNSYGFIRFRAKVN
jgi:large repetitive protein